MPKNLSYCSKGAGLFGLISGLIGGAITFATESIKCETRLTKQLWDTLSNICDPSAYFIDTIQSANSSTPCTDAQVADTIQAMHPTDSSVSDAALASVGACASGILIFLMIKKIRNTCRSESEELSSALLEHHRANQLLCEDFSASVTANGNEFRRKLLSPGCFYMLAACLVAMGFMMISNISYRKFKLYESACEAPEVFGCSPRIQFNETCSGQEIAAIKSDEPYSTPAIVLGSTLPIAAFIFMHFGSKAVEKCLSKCTETCTESSSINSV